MVLQIPLLSSDVADDDFSIDVELDGATFTLEFSYSSRATLWYVSIYLRTDSAPEPIVTGVAVTANYPWLTGVTHPSRPKGELSAESDRDPNRNELGNFAVITYFDAAELGR